MPYDNTNRGSIWKNEKKAKDTDPDFTGQMNAGGVDYWVSAWKRKPDAAANAPALSWSVKPKEARRETMPAARTDGRTVTPRRSVSDDLADEVPF